MLNNVNTSVTLTPLNTQQSIQPMILTPMVGNSSMIHLTPSNGGGDDQNVEIDQPTIVHLRIQKRTGKKCLTFIQGLPESLDLKKFTQKLRKMFHCNCTFIEHPKIGPCVQLSGDFREELKVLFVEDGIVESTKDIKIHGF
jgi:translation initiation factor 1